MPGPNAPYTALDANQVITHVYDEVNDRLRTDATLNIDSATIEVSTSHTDDSIRLGDGTNLTTATVVGPKVGLDVNIITSNLNIRNLVFATDKVDVSNSVVGLDASTLSALENINVNNFPATQVVSATDLDIRNLSASQDNIAISDGTDTLGINTDGSLNIQGASQTLTGTASANNTNIIGPVEVSGYDTIIIHNTGTYVLTGQAQFSNDNVNWVAVLGQTLAATGTAATTTVSTTNTLFKVPVSGRFFRYRTTAFTSGTITANVYISTNDINDYGSRTNVVSGTVSVNANNSQVTGTGAALNATPIALTTVATFDVAMIAITGTWVATLVAEGSNDGVNFFNVPVQRVNSLTSLPMLSITTTGLYRLPLDFNQFRLRISSYTSGTVAANARISVFSAESLNPKPTVESGTSVIVYNEVTSVASAVNTIVATYTATTSGLLKLVQASGTNIARYTVELNGTPIDRQYTTFGSEPTCLFQYDKGVNLVTSDVVTLRVLHTRPTVGDFNSKIMVLEG